MVAFSLFGFSVYRYGIMYLISFLVGWCFLEHITRKKLIQKINPHIQSLLNDNVDTLMTHIIIGGILGGRLGEILIYEPGYYLSHPLQILNVRAGGMSFIGGIVGALIAIGLFLFLSKKNTSTTTHNDAITLIDIIAVITPLGIALGRIGNFLNRELYGPVVNNLDLISSQSPAGGFDRSRPFQRLRSGSLGVQGRLYTIMQKIGLLYDYGTTQFFQHELRLNTNFLASFGEGLLILIILQALFRTRRTKNKLKTGTLSGLFLILYSIVRFLLEYVRIDSLDDYIRGLTSTQRLSIVMCIVGLTLVIRPRKK